MSYQILLNDIKERYDETWLTPSQKKIYEMITCKYTTQRVINIFGESGSGKTFLAWNLEKRLSATRTTDITTVEDVSLLIVDDCSHKKSDVRMMIQEMHFRSINRLILITEKKVDDDIVCLFLNFDSEDKKFFKSTLWKNFNFSFREEKDEYTMNSLIKYNLVSEVK